MWRRCWARPDDRRPRNLRRVPDGGSVTLTSSCVYTLTVPDNTTDGGTGLPVVAGHVSIQGNGATITRSAAASTAAFRIFVVALGGSLTLNSVMLSNGLADDGVNGGGAINSSGSLTVSLSTFTGNTAQEGGGIFNQSTTGDATVTDSTFTGDTATIFGGGALVSRTGRPA